MKEGEEIFLDGLLNGTEGVAMSADASGRRGKVEEGSQPLDLDVDSGGTQEFSGCEESIVRNVRCLVQVLQGCLHKGNGCRWGC